ncbi:unnamed protein product [Dovyalis caffra]|uniref:Uncharacterized protein n=1 Tax=Dovyalis caffra TaxID=77055 RepID=A0AAV1RCI7_9ROSI|nr:unnamed protein product [Dovyalis caffra]
MGEEFVAWERAACGSYLWHKKEAVMRATYGLKEELEHTKELKVWVGMAYQRKGSVIERFRGGYDGFCQGKKERKGAAMEELYG